MRSAPQHGHRPQVGQTGEVDSWIAEQPAHCTKAIVFSTHFMILQSLNDDLNDPFSSYC
jgi:hypothetical protein